MASEPHTIHKMFERGIVIVSIDTEQMWGYLDRLNEPQFESQYPTWLEAHENLLAALSSAAIKATWFVVGGMALPRSAGGNDVRMAGLPSAWVARIPSGTESTNPLWYRHSFIKRVVKSRPLQEIGLHGGLTHLIWTDPKVSREVARCELTEGIKALQQSLVQPRSFSFGREQEAHRDLLPAFGIRSYRGRTPVLASQLGATFPGAVLRVLDELLRTAPPPVWPQEELPGLWNIPSSLFLYPIGRLRARVLPLASRVERFSRGIEAAARYRGIFHFCLHPENLAESPHGKQMLDSILDRLIRARERGDVEVLTVSDVVSRLEATRECATTGNVGSTQLHSVSVCAGAQQNHCRLSAE